MAIDNNLLLIILIGVALIWIFNINTDIKHKGKQEKKKVEKFTSEYENKNIPLLRQQPVSDNELIDKLYAQNTTKTPSKISVPRDSYTSGEKPNQTQKLLDTPPSQINEQERLRKYNEMASQFVSDTKQKMYSKDNPVSGKEDKEYQAFNDKADYMLLPKNNLPDPKFNKVMPAEIRQTLQSSDLLPMDENKDWFQNPSKDFNLMQAVDLEVPEIKIGVDTVGQSRKNATYDIRAAPPCPKFVVSPWGNSTIEQDYNTKPLC